jgi:peptide/nickel transport system substrate-binding protein
MIMPRGNSVRVVRHIHLCLSALILAGLLTGCAQPSPAPPAAKPADTAKPAEAAKPAAAGSPVAAAAPAAAASPVAAKPAGQAKGQIVVVNESEPDTIVPKDASTNISYFVLDNVYDHLTSRDYSSGAGKLAPQLADSWTRGEGNSWRFKLHQGVKFTNGEPFNADAVVTAVEDMADPQAPGRSASEYGNMVSAKKIDDFTVDITTKDPDPILPERLVHFAIPAPNWLKTANLTTSATQAVGSGPYMLDSWQPGSGLLFKANPDYWGPNKPRIAEIKLLGRAEQVVRAAMLQAGEADLAFHIAPEAVKQVPRSIIEQTQEVPMFRINSEHPVLKDVRVRQAIAEATDRQGMIDTLFPGIAVPANGQVVRQGSVGWNPNLKPYPYNPEHAKQLMQETGAVGTPVEYVDRPGSFPRAGEVGELIVNELNQIGFKATVRHLEAAAWREAFLAVKPDQNRTDLQQTSVSNPILDSSRAIDVYYACGGRNHIGCDPEYDRRYAEAKVLTGDARDKAFQELWAYAYDKYWYVPLFGLNWVHGATTRLQWTPRIDGLVLFSEMDITN